MDMSYLSCDKISQNIERLHIYFTLGRNIKAREKMRKISHEKMTHLCKICVTMTDLMEDFYEATELSGVICDECTKSSSTTRKFNFEKKLY